MQVSVNRGMLSKRSSSLFGDDGFVVLFPGIYEAELMVGIELVLYKRNGDKAYLPMIKIDEKVASGQITLL